MYIYIDTHINHPETLAFPKRQGNAQQHKEPSQHPNRKEKRSSPLHITCAHVDAYTIHRHTHSQDE